MGKHIDLTGNKYGKLTVIEYLGKSIWKCQCECGKEVHVRTADLTTGHTKSCGCLVKKYKKDETFFEQIDSEEKAYSLGFISADGSINIKNNLIKIDQKTENEDVLIKIKNAMCYNNTIKHYYQKTNFGNLQYDSYVSRLNISSKKMVNDIQKYGITENKSNSLDVNFELIPQKFLKDFLRGLFDGDGCISVGEYWTLNLTSSDIMINKIILLIENKFNEIKIYKYHRREENQDNATLIIRNKEYIKEVLVI